MDIPKNFLIVEFENNSISLVHAKWILQPNRCYWPSYADPKRERAVRCAENPDTETWSLHAIRRVMKSYATYSEGRLHIPKARVTSDLTSDDDARGRGKRKQICVPRILESKQQSLARKFAAKKLKKLKTSLRKIHGPPKMLNLRQIDESSIPTGSVTSNSETIQKDSVPAVFDLNELAAAGYPEWDMEILSEPDERYS